MKILKLIGTSVLASAVGLGLTMTSASAFALAPSANATVKPPVTKTCTTTTVTTHKLVKVITYKLVHRHWVEVVTYKSVPVVTRTRVCTKTPTPTPPTTPPPTPTSISVGPITFQQLGCTEYQVNMISNPVYGDVGVLTWTDIDTNINGVRVADNGPVAFGPLPFEGPGYAAGSPELAPGTYTLTLDLRSGSDILATSAPVSLVVPALVGC